MFQKSKDDRRAPERVIGIWLSRDRHAKVVATEAPVIINGAAATDDYDKQIPQFLNSLFDCIRKTCNLAFTFLSA